MTAKARPIEHIPATAEDEALRQRIAALEQALAEARRDRDAGRTSRGGGGGGGGGAGSAPSSR